MRGMGRCRAVNRDEVRARSFFNTVFQERRAAIQLRPAPPVWRFACELRLPRDPAANHSDGRASASIEEARGSYAERTAGFVHVDGIRPARRYSSAMNEGGAQLTREDEIRRAPGPRRARRHRFGSILPETDHGPSDSSVARIVRRRGQYQPRTSPNGRARSGPAKRSGVYPVAVADLRGFSFGRPWRRASSRDEGLGTSKL